MLIFFFGASLIDFRIYKFCRLDLLLNIVESNITLYEINELLTQTLYTIFCISLVVSVFFSGCYFVLDLKKTNALEYLRFILFGIIIVFFNNEDDIQNFKFYFAFLVLYKALSVAELCSGKKFSATTSDVKKYISFKAYKHASLVCFYLTLTILKRNRIEFITLLVWVTSYIFVSITKLLKNKNKPNIAATQSVSIQILF